MLFGSVMTSGQKESIMLVPSKTFTFQVHVLKGAAFTFLHRLVVRFYFTHG